ncbi:hypothetical protein CBOM_08037 [Ceraceosorus bombacis]|uniref:Uncharacterized protein n=1 Tax=Ceraceosorus bombacis TaxID=401625 RepID=A0A0P1BL33_9BASI|nr:hypothetical protein CBOM_08037 [Ceraceosorus bombacis]
MWDFMAVFHLETADLLLVHSLYEGHDGCALRVTQSQRWSVTIGRDLHAHHAAKRRAKLRRKPLKTWALIHAC